MTFVGPALDMADLPILFSSPCRAIGVRHLRKGQMRESHAKCVGLRVSTRSFPHEILQIFIGVGLALDMADLPILFSSPCRAIGMRHLRKGQMRESHAKWVGLGVSTRSVLFALRGPLGSEEQFHTLSKIHVLLISF